MAKYPIEYAARMAKAIAAASRSLGKEDAEQGPAWRELLNAERAWPLSVLLSFWYILQSGRDAAYRAAIQSLADESRASTPAANFYAIWGYFDTYKDLLNRPAQLAYEAKTGSDIAGASGAFKYAAQQIGAVPLTLALKSSLFAAVSERIVQVVPAPGGASTESAAGNKGSQRASSAAAPGARATLTAAPALSAQDRCVLLLVSRGHSQSEAEQICQGPPRSASRPLPAAKGKRA